MLQVKGKTSIYYTSRCSQISCPHRAERTSVAARLLVSQSAVTVSIIFVLEGRRVLLCFTLFAHAVALGLVLQLF
jgi:hypothetical protein